MRDNSKTTDADNIKETDYKNAENGVVHGSLDELQAQLESLAKQLEEERLLNAEKTAMMEKTLAET